MTSLVLIIATLWTGIVAAVGAEALRRARRSRETTTAAAAPLPSYVLLRPCAGAEPQLFANLTSTAAIAGPPPEEIWFGAHGADAAIPILNAACAELRAQGQRCHTLATQAGRPNAKVEQLAQLTERVRGADALLVCVDSDVDLSGFDIGALLQPFAHPEVAAVWAPFYEVGNAAGAGDCASRALLQGSLHAFALLRHLDPGGLVGKVLALRPAALNDVGGWGALADVLGEDMELGRLFRAGAWRVLAASTCARARPAPRTLAQTIGRYRRWLWVIRAQRPWLMASYPLLFAASIPLLLLCLGAGRHHPIWAGCLATGILASRLAVARGAMRACGLPWRQPIAQLLRGLWADAVMWMAFAGVWGRRTLQWRDRTLRLDRRGRLQQPICQP